MKIYGNEKDMKYLDKLKKINNLKFENIMIQQDFIEVGCYVTYIDLYNDIKLHYYTDNYKIFDILEELVDELEMENLLDED